jgi:hypothetical protein
MSVEGREGYVGVKLRFLSGEDLIGYVHKEEFLMRWSSYIENDETQQVRLYMGPSRAPWVVNLNSVAAYRFDEPGEGT